MPLLPYPPLRAGATIAVVAPSGPVPEDRLEAGLAVLATRYNVNVDRQQVLARDGFLAGPDDARARALALALEDPSIDAVWMARGGYGLMRILGRLPWAALQSRPKAVVGFSDGTALLAAAARAGVATVHGPVVTQLGGLPAEDLPHLWRVLERPGQGVLLEGLSADVPGVAQGPLLGGNLEVFSRLLGTPYLPDVDGAVLFIEDVGERPYRVDRLLTQLELSGVLGRIAAALVGDFVHCVESPSGEKHSPGVFEVIRERLGRIGVPVALGAPVGHGRRNLALPYGADVVLDAGMGVLKYA